MPLISPKFYLSNIELTTLKLSKQFFLTIALDNYPLNVV